MFESVNALILIAIFVIIWAVSISALKLGPFRDVSRVIVSGCVALLSCGGISKVFASSDWNELLTPYVALALAIGIVCLFAVLRAIARSISSTCKHSSQWLRGRLDMGSNIEPRKRDIPSRKEQRNVI